MGSIASSMATFRKCIKNFESTPDVYNYYGELLLDQQKYLEAIEKFDTAVEMERTAKPMAMNVLPLINKALALFQWKQDFTEAEKLCERALISMFIFWLIIVDLKLTKEVVDPDCDIAVATMAQLLLQQGKVTEALKYFEKAATLSRTEGEIINALSYAEATRTQLEVITIPISSPVCRALHTDEQAGTGEIPPTGKPAPGNDRSGKVTSKKRKPQLVKNIKKLSWAK